MNKAFTRAAAIVLLAVTLSGCGVYSADEIQSIKQEAYREGYNAGYNQGAKDQLEIDYEEFLIDGSSIRTIEERVYKKFRMTPREAFSVYDEYTYDWTHGGFTWSEYQEALEAMYYTASIFPFDY